MQGRGIDYDQSSIPENFRLEKFCIQTEYLCDGQLKIWNGRYQEVFSPICTQDENGQLKQIMIGKYPLLDETTAKKVLTSAEKAWDSGRGFWPTLLPKQRIKYLAQFLSEFKKLKEEIVKYLMWEIGKSLPDATREFDRTVEYIKETIQYYDRKTTSFKKPKHKDGTFAYVALAPRGIALCMGPYNYPLNETFTTIIPALITGNIVILKPPRLGVLLHRPILSLFQKIFPAGVVSTVYGEGQKVITPLLTSGKIDVLAFIGTSRVADLLKRLHPEPHRLHTIFGLEAKNPAIIFADCDFNATVAECLSSALSYNGQRCTALKLFFVEEKLAAKFAEGLAKQLKSVAIKNPWEKNAKITPLPEITRSLYLEDLVQDAKNFGSEVINEAGGQFNLTYFKPAVLFPVGSKTRIFKEEQFGPLLPVVSFTDLNTVVNSITESKYGQQLSVFTKSRSRVQTLAALLGNQVSRINVNVQCQRGPDTMPFTGRKNSAEGVLSVSEGIKEFTIPLVLATNYSFRNKKLLS